MSKTVKITLHPLGKTIKVNRATPLIDVLHEFGVEFPCGGKGTCGACKIKLLDGELAIDANQQKRLHKLKLGDNWRLACFCKAESDITLEISQFEHIILADNTPFDFNPQHGFGIAVDLGTTTVVVQLINLENGHILDSVSDVNPQAKYGGDLIARIQFCLDGKQNELQHLIRTKIAAMIDSMLHKYRLEVSKVALVGNTVMQHIFCGLNVQPLSFYPFESNELGVKTFTAKDLNWNLPNAAKIKFHSSIGSFVGSDILAGIAATKMAEQKAFSILIDLGTNGEIVVGNCDKIVCASTAAGPAFEGAKIQQGMRATTGAISSVEMENGKLKSHVIGNVKAKGICGSGLIDVMAILLDQQQIGMFGEINSGAENIPLSPKVTLTQQDIREFQLAKAAIAAGTQMLLNQLGISMSDVAHVFIAGGFGNFLNTKNVIRTGLIEAVEEKIYKLGNTALIGAKMFLFENMEFTQAILGKTTHINLEGDGSFQDIYIEKMMLV
ncbi:ASKHA domain-containing protein [Prolixibacteraceae bacterium Z1-6]|uniref:ASKHA domain-containing protein n=1 Tax=Draconibacterium aestuarii TaxID=2998507 RepID=A0A9X3FED3_9BACT|nr:ASKHA domain-containing protein [Prolixibacteraceae bacterium Z1-6]